MTQVCDYCGELKPCLKYNMNFEKGKQAGHSFVLSRIYFFDWICKECMTAKEIIIKIEEEVRKKIEYKQQKKWKKLRDKLLNRKK